jgi:hypothetical protein
MLASMADEMKTPETSVPIAMWVYLLVTLVLLLDNWIFRESAIIRVGGVAVKWVRGVLA